MKNINKYETRHHLKKTFVKKIIMWGSTIISWQNKFIIFIIGICVYHLQQYLSTFFESQTIRLVTPVACASTSTNTAVLTSPLERIIRTTYSSKVFAIQYIHQCKDKDPLGILLLSNFFVCLLFYY